MHFPFENDPKQDPKKVSMCFIQTDTLEEKQALLNLLVEKGYRLMSHDMQNDLSLETIAIPLHGLGFVGYASMHVRAEQTYHGAKTYPSLRDFLLIQRDL